MMSSEQDVPAVAQPPRLHWRQMSLLIVGLIFIAVGVAWQLKLLPFGNSLPRQNAIMVIAPYRHQGTWVFDDSSAGLVQEPFVAGVPEMIDEIVADIPNADKGVRLLFSAKPFPKYQKKLVWLRGDQGGNYYRFEDSDREGWICPAMFKYYETAPKALYVKAELLK